MRLGKYLSSLTRPELEELKELLNLTNDEMEVFSMLAKGKSLIEVSMENRISISTLKRRIERIKRKVERVVVTVTIDGKEVKDISKIELPEEIVEEIKTLVQS